MPIVVINDTNHTGLFANITFTSTTNDISSFNYQQIPFQFDASILPNENYFGTYELYYSAYNQTCQYNYIPPSFRSVWNITNDVELPYSPTGTYSGIIDWGDGNVSENTYANRYHQYDNPGTYTITITGTIEGWSFANYGVNYENIIEVISFGPLRGENNSNYGLFYYCYNLNLTNVTDTPNLLGITSLDSMFGECYNLTTINNIENWNVSNVTNMSGMFATSQFNQDISSWNVSGVTDMNFMFSNSPFNQNILIWNVSNVTNMSGMFNSTPFNQDISNWNVSGVTNMSYMFAGSQFNQDIGSWNVGNVQYMNSMFYNTSSFNQNIGSWNVSGVTDMNSMFYFANQFNRDLSNWCVSQIPSLPFNFDIGTTSWTGGTATRPQWGYCPFVSIWRTTSPNQTIYLPIYNGGNYNFNVNWGDGASQTITSYITNSHTYVSTGDYTVTITGTIEGFDFGQDATSRNNILEITSWGNLKLLDGPGSYFAFCSNLNLPNVVGTLNLQSITNLNSMFLGCTSLTTINNINSWDMNSVTFLQFMFNSTPFNSNISNWNVGNVQNMRGMFENNSNFNQPIGNWNVSNVGNMGRMFQNATQFNQNLSSWCVSGLTAPTDFDTGATNWVLPRPNWGAPC